MHGIRLIILLCCLVYVSCGDPSENDASPSSYNAFDQTIDAEIIEDRNVIRWSMKDEGIDKFISIYGKDLGSFKELEIEGLTNKAAEILLDAISDAFEVSKCSLTSVAFKGIQDRFCPSMERKEKKRPCKMNREVILRRLATTFSNCPLESFSIEANAFSATAIIELAQNVSSGLFPSLSLLNVDDNNYNYDNIALPKLVRIVNEMPRGIEVRSFYVDTENVIKHNHGDDTPFRYNFDDRYPAECQFYSEPIKDEEFEILIKYQPCIYANSLLAHGTSRGLPWVNYMTIMFGEATFVNLKNMEIFGNDLYKGDVDALMATFTAEHLPALQYLDMSCMCRCEV